MTTKQQAKNTPRSTGWLDENGFYPEDVRFDSRPERSSDELCVEDAETRRELYRRGIKHGE